MQFLKDVWHEMRLTTWPSGGELVRYTGIVLSTITLCINLIELRFLIEYFNNQKINKIPYSIYFEFKKHIWVYIFILLP